MYKTISKYKMLSRDMIDDTFRLLRIRPKFKRCGVSGNITCTHYFSYMYTVNYRIMFLCSRVKKSEPASVTLTHIKGGLMNVSLTVNERTPYIAVDVFNYFIGEYHHAFIDDSNTSPELQRLREHYLSIGGTRSKVRKVKPYYRF